MKVGIESLRGLLKFIEHDLPRAFSNLDDLHLLGDLADRQIEASQALGAYIEHLESEVAPRARASFRLGRERFEQKVRLEEGIGLPVDRLLAIASRELASTQEAFKTLATRRNGGDPMAVWSKTKDRHPAPGQLVDRAHGPDAVQVLGRGRLRLGLALRHQRQEPVAAHDVVDEPDGPWLSDGEGDGRQREHDRVPERQDRERVGNGEVSTGSGAGLERHQAASPRFGSVMRSRPRS